MNIYMMGLLSKWVSIIPIFLASLFGFSDENKTLIENTNIKKNAMAIAEEIPFTVENKYNENLPKGTENIIIKGQNGIAYIINGEKQVIESPINQVTEIGTKENAIYTGKMTGYGADCVGCSGNGTVSCKTKKGSTFSLIKHGNIYNDEEYGNVRILAAALDRFPCGTMIKVTHQSYGTFNAVVLDTGSAMRSAWNNGIVHMDLAFVTQKNNEINLSTTNKAKYEVLRWGW